MLSTILILCVVIWVPILLYLLVERNYTILLIWLLIAPVALNVIKNPSRNPFFTPQLKFDYIKRLEFEKYQRTRRDDAGYLGKQGASITAKELLDPTRLLIVSLAFLLLFEKIYRNRQPLPLDRAEFWMLIFSAILVVNVILQSGRMANGLKVSLDAFIVPFLAYALARRLIHSEARFQQFLWVITGLGAYLICIALVERALNPNLLYRVKGPFLARNHFSAVMMVVFFMALLAHLRYRFEPDTLRRAARWFVIIGAPLGIAATLTRSNWLGFLCGIWTLLLFARRFIPRGAKIVSLGLVLLFVPILFVGFQSLVPSEVVDDRISNLNTIYARIGAWIIQIQEGVKNPIMGIGFNNVRQLLGTERIYFMGIRSETSSHNCFLAFFVELGIFGLIAYLAMAGSILRTGFRQYRHGLRSQHQWIGICIMSILVAYLVPGLTSTMLYIPTMSHVYIFACLGALSSLASLGEPARPLPPRGPMFMKLRRTQPVT